MVFKTVDSQDTVAEVHNDQQNRTSRHDSNPEHLGSSKDTNQMSTGKNQAGGNVGPQDGEDRAMAAKTSSASGTASTWVAVGGGGISFLLATLSLYGILRVYRRGKGAGEAFEISGPGGRGVSYGLVGE
ncbi:hypothetical protein C922_05675 [Plasmodium inui San Antonio 1]|uniref:Uncharacterized protein n=1 Tax=Plasmodium inui San Antonio 1 TaxID=1237626 RepID=W6ZSP6_9APIC|nr:hypothetical protein C922_05675 [Plasmodium inui San Antonio 1]EUD63942.1 hypothetical protein C922_05675 [Plasmodium inui San Antonio 1]